MSEEKISEQNSRLTQNPDEITRAIVGCVSIGGGDMTNVSVNGVIVKEKVVWKTYCIMDPLYGGLVCDNELVVRITPKDTWSGEVMNNYGIVVNRVDAKQFKDVEEVKRKHAKRGKIINV